MTPDMLIIEIGSLIERICQPRYDRTTADVQPITKEQFDRFSDEVLLLCKRNTPKEVVQ